MCRGEGQTRTHDNVHTKSETKLLSTFRTCFVRESFMSSRQNNSRVILTFRSTFDAPVCPKVEAN